MARMTFETISAEGRKISQALDMMENIMSDPTTIQEQAKQVRRNGDAQAAKLRALTAALSFPCLDCGHPRTSHDKGMAHCGEGSVVNGVTSHCTCIGWAVEFA